MGEIDYGEIQQVLDDLLGQNVDFQNMACLLYTSDAADE